MPPLPEERENESELTWPQVVAEVVAFSERREWGEFHSPRNLILALVGEVGELAAEVQWSSDELSEMTPEQRKSVANEMADVQNYLILLAERLDIDLLEALKRKLAENDVRYPVDSSRGSSKKSPRVLPSIEDSTGRDLSRN